jgi:hypothetical protein
MIFVRFYWSARLKRMHPSEARIFLASESNIVPIGQFLEKLSTTLALVFVRRISTISQCNLAIEDAFLCFSALSTLNHKC